jgi:hypothetical protein
MVPFPTVVDLSTELHQHMNISEQYTTSASEFFVTNRIIVLPSGMGLSEPFLVESLGTWILGKLVFGGVEVGGREEGNNNNNDPRVHERNHGKYPRKSTQLEDVRRTRETIPKPSTWDRPEFLEIILLPRSKTSDDTCSNRMMTIRNWAWNPQQMYDFYNRDVESLRDDSDPTFRGSVSYLSGRERNDAFRQDFVSAMGGFASPN